MNDIQQCVDRFQEIKARVKELSRSLEETASQIDQKKEYLEILIKAKWVLSEVSRLTQQRFKERVESLVTMAIRSVFDRPFGFELIFERKRDKMECRPIVYETVGDKRIEYEDPKDDMGGSIIDIISFALRIILWSLEKPSSRNVIILDEPMKNMGNLINLGGRVLRKISHKLSFQLIIVTHEMELNRMADVAYLVEHNGKFSEVKRISSDGAVVNQVGTKRHRLVLSRRKGKEG